MNRDYEFSVQVTGLDIESESQLKQLKDDTITVVPFASDDLIMLGVEMAAESPESAFSEFKSFLNECASGIKIKRVDLDLVSLSQIAERLDITREAVRLWAIGQRRKGFPEPFTSAGQSLLWAWSDVFDWLTEEEIQEDPLPLPINLIERLNGVYARDRITAELGWLSSVTQRGQTYHGQLSDGMSLTPAKSSRDKVKYDPPLITAFQDKAAM